MSIVVEDGKISIKREELDLLRVVELKQALEGLLKEGCTRLTLDMWGVKGLSGTGTQVISSLGKRFDSF